MHNVWRFRDIFPMSGSKLHALEASQWHDGRELDSVQRNVAGIETEPAHHHPGQFVQFVEFGNGPRVSAAVLVTRIFDGSMRCIGSSSSIFCFVYISLAI